MDKERKGQRRERRFGRRESDFKPRFPEMPDGKPEFETTPLSRAEYIAALAHFYRAEMHRSLRAIDLCQKSPANFKRLYSEFPTSK